MYIHIHMYIYIYICIHTHMYTHISQWTGAQVHAEKLLAQTAGKQIPSPG